MPLADQQPTWTKRGLSAFLLLPGLIYLLAYAAFTWPAITSFGSHFLGDAGDGFQNVWNIWWINHAVVELGTHPWTCELLHYPSGTSLIGQTMNPINGLLGIPLGVLMDQVHVYNVLVVFAFVATGVACFWLAWFLQRDYWVSVFVGGAFTFSAYHFAHAMAHMQLVTMYGLPLFLLTWLMLLDKPTLKRALLAAAAFLLVVLSDYYYTIYCVIAAVLLLAGNEKMLLRPRLRLNPKLHKPLATFVIAASVLTGPILIALVVAALNKDLDGYHPPRNYSMDLLAPFIPGGRWFRAEWTSGFWSKLPGNVAESDVYVRWSLIIPAAFAVFRHGVRKGSPCRPWLIVGAVFFAISLGPRFQFWGHHIERVPTPYSVLESLLPVLENGGTPVRFAVMGLLSTCLIAGFGLRPFLTRVFRGHAWLFLLIFAFETWPKPQPLTRPVVADFVEELRDLPRGAVADMTGTKFERLLRQTQHEHPMIDGYLSRYPSDVSTSLTHKENAYREGRYRELMELGEARYLVLPNAAIAGADGQALRVLFTGQDMSILIHDDDVLASKGGR